MLRNSRLYILSIVLSCCVDAGFCYNPLESAEVFALQLSLWSDSGCKFHLSSCMWWCRSPLSAQSPCDARQVCPAHAQLTASPRLVWFHSQSQETSSPALFTLGTALVPLARKMGLLSQFQLSAPARCCVSGPLPRRPGQCHEIQRIHLSSSALSTFCSPLSFASFYFYTIKTIIGQSYFVRSFYLQLGGGVACVCCCDHTGTGTPH